MVRSKEAPKKPKDPLLMTPPSKPRGGFLDGGRPWNRGGAAMSPTPASVPNYMWGTSSSDAKAGPGRRGRSVVSSPSASASPARRRPAVRVVTRGKVLFPEVPGSGGFCSGPGLGRATCSSTMKEVKFPAMLDLAPGATDAEGPAAMRVCPYTYCSLNGHVHAPAVPLRSFLASRRRLIKTQQSMKLKGVSAFRKKSADKNGDSGGAVKVVSLIDEEAAGDFFVEVYAGPRVSSDMSCSDMSLDEMDATVRRMEFVMFDRLGADEDHEGKDLAACDDAEPHPRLEEKHGACRDSSSECSDSAMPGFFEELPWMRYHGYEYDSLDDEISEEQRVRGEETGGAEVSMEQEGKNEDMTSGRSVDGGEQEEQEATEEQEAAGEEDISDLSSEMEEMDGRDEDKILDRSCRGEPSAEQRALEQSLSDDACKLEIPDQEATGRVDSKTSSEVTEKQNVNGEEIKPDDSSEMEISEEAISGDGCREDFSEEVTSSRAVPGDNTFEQDGTVDGVEDGQKELESTAYILEEASVESGVVAQETDHDDISSCVYDGAHVKSDITTFKSEDASEGSVVSQESSLNDTAECDIEGAEVEPEITRCKLEDISVCVYDGAHMEPEITTCKLKDASEGSVVTQESNLNDTAECDTEGAEVEPEVTRCKLEDTSEETCGDQQIVEEYETASLSDCARNGSESTTCISSVTTQEADQSGKYGDVSSDSENDSELTTSKLTDTAISGDNENESDVTTWKSEDVSEDFFGQEANHDDSSTIRDGTQTKSDVTICESGGAQQASEIVIEENEDNTMDSQKETETTTCESLGASEKEPMLQDADENVNTIFASDCAQLNIVIPKLVACEDIHITEDANEPSNVHFLEQQHDFSVKGHSEPQNIPAESTDAKETSLDDICDAFSGMNLKGHSYFVPAESATCPGNKLIISRRRTLEEEECLRGFNPRAPNFLPLELDPDAEKVDLRHQMMDERKNSEEWMIDYALRRALTNLAPARKKKVELLVQAFETVLPHDQDDKKNMSPTTPVQACI